MRYAPTDDCVRHVVARQFQHDDLAGFWTWLPMDASILKAAAETFTTLPSTIFLRSSDCTHLITALNHRFNEFLTFDTHQTEGAIALGLTVVTG